MARKPDNIDQLVQRMIDGRYIRAKYWRRAIDNNKFIRQKFKLQAEYVERFKEFAAAARQAAKEGGGRQTFEFEGQRFQARSALRTAASVNNRSGEFGRANFKQQSYTLKKLFPELAAGQELGHKNMSVLRASLASTISVMEPEDVRRGPLKALYALVLQIDEITDVGEQTLPDLISDLQDSIRAGYTVKGTMSKDVDMLRGIRGSLELEFEPTDINQFKGRLAGEVGAIFREVILGNSEGFNQLFEDVDVSQIRGSRNMVDEVLKQSTDILDPKKTQKKSKTNSKSRPKKLRNTAPKMRKPRKTRQRAPSSGATRGVSSSPLELIAILNEQLPNTVAKNMGSPRLNYRTGRFASSVNVTDIALTAKGFPSIGYTYMRYPYETFEPGNLQGSVDRDPRKLIDVSIREIAAQFAIGRFYTRRV